MWANAQSVGNMAVLNNDEDSNQNNIGGVTTANGGGQNSQGGGGQQVGGNAPITLSNNAGYSQGSGKGPSSNAPNLNGTPQSSSSGTYNNLQNYLNANAGYNSKGGGLAGQINNNLQDKAQTNVNNIDKAQQDWISQNSQYNIDPNQASQYTQQAIANPTQYTDPNSINQFQQYLNAQTNYKAPTGFDANGSLANANQNYQQLSNNVNSESGRYNLLNQLYGNGNYNQGQQSLDNLLLQANPNQIDSLQSGVQSSQNNLNDAYQNTLNNVNNNLIPQYAQNAAQTQADTQGALGGAINNFGTAAQQSIDSAISGRDAAYQQAVADLHSGIITPQESQLLGVNQSTQTYGLDPSKYINKSNATPTLQNIITPEQQQQINALSQLAGTSLSGDPSKVLASYANNNQAGSYDSKPYSYDLGGLQNAGGQAQALINQLPNGEKYFYNSSGGPKLTPQQALDRITEYGKFYGAISPDQYAKYMSSMAPIINNLQQLNGMGYDTSKYGNLAVNQDASSNPFIQVGNGGGMVRPS